jgi:hypothetical protein
MKLEVLLTNSAAENLCKSLKRNGGGGRNRTGVDGFAVRCGKTAGAQHPCGLAGDWLIRSLLNYHNDCGLATRINPQQAAKKLEVKEAP